jgi:non-specific serine/threonine protein kinase
MAFSLVILGVAAEDAGDYDRANALLEEGLAHSRASDDATDIGLALFHLGVVAWGQGDVEQAVERLDEALAVQRAAGDLAYGAGESLAFLGLIACERGDLAQSVDLQRESLLLHLTIDSTEVLAVNLANVAMVAAATRRLNAAARLFGAAFALREVIGNPFKLPERAVYERAIGALRSALPEDAFAVAWQSERTFSLAEAAADAAAVLDEIGNEAATGGASQVHAAAVADGIASLTPRELEVLRLLVEGRSDREIAEALFISPRTAQGHVAHIFSKLDVSTRMAAVATAIRAGLVTDRRAAG